MPIQSIMESYQEFFKRPDKTHWNTVPQLRNMRYEYELKRKILDDSINSCDCGKFAIAFSYALNQLDELGEKTFTSLKGLIFSELGKSLTELRDETNKTCTDGAAFKEAAERVLKADEQRRENFRFTQGELENELNYLMDDLLQKPIIFNGTCSCGKKR